MFKQPLQGVNLHQGFNKIARRYRKRVRSNKDVVVAITGTRGVGKSLLSFVLKYCCNKKFDFKDVVLVPTEENVRKALDNTPQYGGCIVDETVQLLYKMDFMSNTVKYLYKKFQRERKFNRIVFLNIQNFLDLPKGFRDDIVNSWIHVFKTGHAVVFNKLNIIGNTDPWLIEYVKKETSKLQVMKSFSNLDNQLRYLQNMPNYVGEIIFPKEHYERLYLHSGIEAEYEALSKQANIEVEASQQEEKGESVTLQKYKVKLATGCKYLNLVGFANSQIAQLFGIGAKSVERYLKQSEDLELKELPIHSRLKGIPLELTKAVNTALVSPALSQQSKFIIKKRSEPIALGV